MISVIVGVVHDGMVSLHAATAGDASKGSMVGSQLRFRLGANNRSVSHPQPLPNLRVVTYKKNMLVVTQDLMC